MNEKTNDDYERNIKKEFLNLNTKKVDLRTDYINSFQIVNDKEKIKLLLAIIAQKRQILKNKTNYLSDIRENLEKAKIFDRQTIFQIISYLISVIENQEYDIFKYNLSFHDDKSQIITDPINYNFIYLTPIEETNHSKEELNIKYPYELSAKKVNIEELFNGETYTGLGLFKDWDNSEIIFHKKPINTISSEQQNTFGYINTKRFPYVNDFLNKVIKYRIYKEDEFSYPIEEPLTYEDLYNLANQFIDEYQNTKTIDKLSK